jgi:hypothetical protein
MSGMYPSWNNPEALREEAGRVAHFPIYHYREWMPTLNLPKSHAPRLDMSARMFSACRRMKGPQRPPDPSLVIQARNMDAATQRYYEDANFFTQWSQGQAIELARFPVLETEIGVINAVDQWIDFKGQTAMPIGISPYWVKDIYGFDVRWIITTSQKGRYPLGANAQGSGDLPIGNAYPVNAIPGGRFWSSFTPETSDMRYPWFGNAFRKLFWIVPGGNVIRLFLAFDGVPPEATQILRFGGRLAGYVQSARTEAATKNTREGYR